MNERDEENGGCDHSDYLRRRIVRIFMNTLERTTRSRMQCIVTTVSMQKRSRTSNAKRPTSAGSEAQSTVRQDEAYVGTTCMMHIQLFSVKSY